MIEKVTDCRMTEGETLKNLITVDSLIINHVLIDSGQTFPAHITENDVYIIIVKGEISIRLNDQPEHKYKKGNMISIPQGVVSGLSNSADKQAELFVVKSNAKK